MGKMILQWIIYAKQQGICKETGNKINIGDTILYIPSGKYSSAATYCNESNAYRMANSKDEYHITGYCIDAD
jgi:hypothetical protein